MSFSKLLKQSIAWRGGYFAVILLLNIVLGRLLQAELAGWVYYFTNIFSLVILIASLSLETALGYFAAKAQIEKQALAWFSILYISIVTLFLVGICFAIPVSFSTSLPIAQSTLYWYGASFFIGNSLCNYFTSLFYADNKYQYPQSILIITNLILIGIIVAASFYNKPIIYILHIYFAFFFIQGFAIATAYLLHYKTIFLPVLPNWQQAKQIILYAFLIVGGNLIFFLVYRIDYWFVANYPSSSAADVGNYIQASKMGQILLIIPQILASVIFPQTAQKKFVAEIKDSLSIITRLLIQFFIILFCLNLVFGKWVTVAVFGVSFNTMFIWLGYLLPGICSLSILALFSAYFSGNNLVKINIYGAALALVAVCIGNFLFVPAYGVLAAAIVSSVGYSINLFYALYQYRKRNKNNGISVSLFNKYDYVWLVKTILSK